MLTTFYKLCLFSKFSKYVQGQKYDFHKNDIDRQILSADPPFYGHMTANFLNNFFFNFLEQAYLLTFSTFFDYVKLPLKLCDDKTVRL